MSIVDYSSLQASVSNWMARSDLTATIPDFITISEAEFNRKLRVNQMMATQSTTPSAGTFELPADYLEWVRVTWTGSLKRSLQYVHPSYLQSQFPDTPTATPSMFTIEGSTDNLGLVRIMPIDPTAIDFTYYQKITGLSTSNTSNWLLAAHPDVYLAGAMTEGSVFTKDYQTAGLWKERRDNLLDEIKRLDQKSRAPSSIRPIGRNP